MSITRNFDFINSDGISINTLTVSALDSSKIVMYTESNDFYIRFYFGKGAVFYSPEIRNIP